MIPSRRYVSVVSTNVDVWHPVATGCHRAIRATQRARLPQLDVTGAISLLCGVQFDLEPEVPEQLHGAITWTSELRTTGTRGLDWTHLTPNEFRRQMVRVEAVSLSGESGYSTKRPRPIGDV